MLSHSTYWRTKILVCKADITTTVQGIYRKTLPDYYIQQRSLANWAWANSIWITHEGWERHTYMYIYIHNTVRCHYDGVSFLQGWGQVKYLYLVLGTWCKLSSTWYLLVLDLFKFKSTWYLLVLDGQSTWYLSKYSSTFVKLTNIHVLVNNSPLNTISRNGSYWLCSQHGSQDVSSQDWTVSLSFRPSVETRWLNIDKILAIIGSGSDLSPVWCKPLQPNRYIVHWSL